MKKGERQKPDIYYDRLAKLKPEEKEQLRATLTSPLFVKFLRIVAGMKPAAFCNNAGSQTRDAFSNERAAARLSEICGWELYEFALFKALNDAPKKPTETEPSYPDSGVLSIQPTDNP